MKKSLLTIGAVIALSLTSNAQTILNGNCESAMTEFSSAPGNYYTADGSWGGLELRPETSNVHGGSQAIKVVTTNDPTVNTLTTWGSDIIPGFATNTFDGAMPNVANISVSYWYKTALVGGDSSIVMISVYDTLTAGSTDDVLLYQGYSEYTSSVTTWTNDVITLQQSQNTGTPNHFEILIASSETGLFNSADGHPGSTLWIDDLTYGFAGLENNKTNVVSVYPNPAVDQLNISMNENIAAVSIISTEGKVISTKSVNGTNTTVDVSNLTSGVYMYQVTSSNGVVSTNKFVKK